MAVTTHVANALYEADKLLCSVIKEPFLLMVESYHNSTHGYHDIHLMVFFNFPGNPNNRIDVLTPDYDVGIRQILIQYIKMKQEKHDVITGIQYQAASQKRDSAVNPKLRSSVRQSRKSNKNNKKPAKRS